VPGVEPSRPTRHPEESGRRVPGSPVFETVAIAGWLALPFPSCGGRNRTCEGALNRRLPVPTQDAAIESGCENQIFTRQLTIMQDFGQLLICDHSTNLQLPVAGFDTLPIIDCHEWDGLFSIEAGGQHRRVFLTAWCDGRDCGEYQISVADRIIEYGTTRVTSAPTLVEPDGYEFPPGSTFCCGLWIVECKSTDDVVRYLKLLVTIGTRRIDPITHSGWLDLNLRFQAPRDHEYMVPGPMRGFPTS